MSELSTDSSLSPQQIDEDHVILRQEALKFVERNRARMGLEPFWGIDVQICCPDQMPESEATVIWHSEVWHALLTLRCDVPAGLVPRLILHELLELQRWKTTEVEIQLFSVIKQLPKRATGEYYASWDDREGYPPKYVQRVAKDDHARSGVNPSLLSILEQNLREQRNQEIEQMVYALYGGIPRPYHLSENKAFVYRNPHANDEPHDSQVDSSTQPLSSSSS